MQLQYESAKIIMRKMKQEFTYENTLMLTLDISYPEIETRSRTAQKRINARYQVQATRFFNYAASTLYRNAIREFRDSIKNDFPFRPYDAVMKYEVDMNENCRLSTFYDRYEYTGGAHGNTVRASNTFDLKTGKELLLNSFFAYGQNYRKLLLEQILVQADENVKENPRIYFEDYRTLIVKYFNAQSFFLTPEGISIYYQQYEIAPYSTGIVVFSVSYGSLGIPKPCCD